MNMKKVVLATLLCLIALHAHATEFVRVVNGLAADACYGPDLATALSTSFTPGYIAQQSGGQSAWFPVASGVTVQDNYTVIVTGGQITAATAPSAIPLPPQVLTKAQFQIYSYATLGAVDDPSGTAAQQQLAGITRFGQILLAMKASNDNATAAVLDAYNNNVSFDLPTVEMFAAVVGPAGSNIVTSAETSALIGNWP